MQMNEGREGQRRKEEVQLVVWRAKLQRWRRELQERREQRETHEWQEWVLRQEKLEWERQRQDRRHQQQWRQEQEQEQETAQNFYGPANDEGLFQWLEDVNRGLQEAREQSIIREAELEVEQSEWLNLYEQYDKKLNNCLEAVNHELTEFENEDERLVVSKVVRNMTLTVEFRPDHKLRKIWYSVTATGSQDSYLSKLYIETFEGFCAPRKAAEFLKLTNILNDDTFFVKEGSNMRIQEEGSPTGKRHAILHCEKLETIVKLMLFDGRKLDAVHADDYSYV